MCEQFTERIGRHVHGYVLLWLSYLVGFKSFLYCMMLNVTFYEGRTGGGGGGSLARFTN